MTDEAEVPQELRHVVAFVNTADLEAGTDELGDDAALGRWLARRSLAPAGVRASPGDLALALELREGLRAVLRGHHGGGAADPEATSALRAVGARLPLRVDLDGAGRPSLVPAAVGGGEEGVAGALAAVLADVATAAARGTWERLKVCQADDCRWAFYDRSKNRSGRWCTMRVCGNREKTRAYRERRRAGP